MTPIPREEEPRPAVQRLGWTIIICVGVATFFGLSRRGEPIWDDARGLFLVAGVLAMIQAVLLGGRRSHPWRAIPPGRLLAPMHVVVGLGLLGIGLEHFDPARPWSALAVPLALLIGALFLREAVRGDRGLILGTLHGASRLRRLFLRGSFLAAALCSPIFVVWAARGDL